MYRYSMSWKRWVIMKNSSPFPLSANCRFVCRPTGNRKLADRPPTGYQHVLLYPIQCTVCLSIAVLVIDSTIFPKHCSRQLYTDTSLTGHQQIIPTVGCLSADCWPTILTKTVSQLSASWWSTVGQ